MNNRSGPPPALAYAIVVPPGRRVEPSFCCMAALLPQHHCRLRSQLPAPEPAGATPEAPRPVTEVLQSEVFPRLTLARRRVTMRTGPGSGIRQVPGVAVSTGGVMGA